MDDGLTQYLKQRVETLEERNKKLIKLKGWLLKNHPEIIDGYQRSK